MKICNVNLERPPSTRVSGLGFRLGHFISPAPAPGVVIFAHRWGKKKKKIRGEREIDR